MNYSIGEFLGKITIVYREERTNGAIKPVHYKGTLMRRRNGIFLVSEGRDVRLLIGDSINKLTLFLWNLLYSKLN